MHRVGTTHVVGTDLGVSAQYSSVFYYGVGGLKLDGLLAELSLISELGPRAVIVDIGTNDLSHAGVVPSQLASRIVDFAQRVLAVDSVTEVVICQVMPRVAVRPPWRQRQRYPARADFNNAPFVVNRTLDALTSDLPHIHYWRHMGMHTNWEQYFDHFGVHLNEFGMRIYVRSIRGDAIFAATQW